MKTQRKLKTEPSAARRAAAKQSQLTPLNTGALSSTGGIAIISDIHSNIDALGAVLTDITNQRCFAIFCLGDTVGYGPEPAACVKLMREFAAISLMGNHEAMYLATRGAREKLGPQEFGDLWPPVELCHRHLGADDAKWIAALPLVVPLADMTLVHGSLHEPQTFDYVVEKASAKQHFAKLETRASFYGHTHIPAIWQEKGKTIACYAPREGPIGLDPDCRYAIGVGSVGQPRDHDPRACYVIYQPASDRVEFRRVPYDITRAQARFAKAGLPGFDAERIARGE